MSPHGTHQGSEDSKLVADPYGSFGGEGDGGEAFFSDLTLDGGFKVIMVNHFIRIP